MESDRAHQTGKIVSLEERGGPILGGIRGGGSAQSVRNSEFIITLPGELLGS